MNSLLNYLQNEIIVLVLLAAAAVTIASFIVLPALFRPIQAIRPKEEKDLGKKRAEDKKSSERKGFLNTKTIVKFLLSGLLGLVVFGAGYLAYDFFLRPVRILPAAWFKSEKSESIQLLQRADSAIWKEAGLYLLDIRSREEYASEHLKWSASLPAERAANEKYPIEEVDMVIYSSSSKLEEARRVADAIKKNGDLHKDKYKEKVGRIYVIKDGYEGLKKAGLSTESGGWD